MRFPVSTPDWTNGPGLLDRRSFLAWALAGVGAGLVPRPIRGAGPVGLFSGVTAFAPLEVARPFAPFQRRPVPSPSQLLWQQDELALFLHFGVNTFTDREWGDGTEDPAIFDPARLDARQWARVARETGFRTLVLTAKHHDGFCLWPTATTDHSVAASPWRDGEGDLVREFVDACRAEDLRVGLYCSPWDRNHPTYGDSPRYNAVFLAQLTELLTGYGDVHEVWFDGANGEGPNGRRQEYDWPRFWDHVLTLQPEAVIFSDAGPGVRWIGNERGSAGDPNWSTVHPETVPVPGMTGDEVMRQLQHGDRDGTVWRPGETDVSIRPGWFYHAAENDAVRGPEDLVDLYFTSVGRNSKLLLNVPPTPDGLLHERDVASLRGMRTSLDRIFAADLTEGREARWYPTGDRSGEVVVELGAPVEVAISDLREDIARGQLVERWTLEGRAGGEWTVLAEGETIGYRKLDRFAPRTVDAVRLRVSTLAPPLPVRVGLYV
jgi:alpha-L-fucosidase